jgi:hypothetical protein
MGIEALDIKNKCLLSKWILKLLSEEGCGRSSYIINIFEPRLFLKYKPNIFIILFGRG